MRLSASQVGIIIIIIIATFSASDEVHMSSFTMSRGDDTMCKVVCLLPHVNVKILKVEKVERVTMGTNSVGSKNINTMKNLTASHQVGNQGQIERHPRMKYGGAQV